MTKERQAWEQFLTTGKVEDYLACVGKLPKQNDMDGPQDKVRNSKQTNKTFDEEERCRIL